MNNLKKNNYLFMIEITRELMFRSQRMLRIFFICHIIFYNKNNNSFIYKINRIYSL